MSGENDESEGLSWLSSHSGRGQRFGVLSPLADEQFHDPGPSASPASAETYWFAFHEPKSKMMVHFYMKMQQTIGACAAGSYWYKGFPTNTLQMEHFDLQTSIAMPKWRGSTLSLADYGLAIEILEPLQRWAVRYRPPGGEVEADIQFSATGPAAKTPNNEHFDQAIRAEGTLRIGSERIEAGGHGFRDRTWNANRPEISIKLPPIGYLWGVLDDGCTSFCVRGGDDPAHDVEWKGICPLTTEQQYHGGWICVNGELRAVTRMSKRTQRDPSNKMRPISVQVDLEDDTGAKHKLMGQVTSAMWFYPWGNIFTWMLQFDWTLNGNVHGIGEMQEAAWSHYAKRFWRD